MIIPGNVESQIKKIDQHPSQMELFGLKQCSLFLKITDQIGKKKEFII